MEDKICFTIKGTDEIIHETRMSLINGWLTNYHGMPKDDDEILNHRVTINDIVMYFKTFGDLMKALSGND